MSAPGTCPTCDVELVPSVVATLTDHCPKCGWFLPSPKGNGNGSTLLEVSARTEPPEPPPLDEVLDTLAWFVRRFVVMSPAQADAVALWVVHTHCFAAAEQTPYLAISSAEKRSGKTRLLEVLE